MSKAVNKLIEVMARLRDPKSGCPWDLEQNFKTIAPYTLEETYEVVEAIERNDPEAMKDELGDLLFQIVFHAQMGREAGLFDLDAIAGHVADKMIERHPHVFGDRDANTSAAVLANWETDKAKKREAKAQAEGKPLSVLDGVTGGLPAATHAVKLQNRAARVGFDWTDAKDIIAKIKEETGELKAEIATGSKDAMQDELGDLFFALVNLARRLEIDPEQALRGTNRKFERRFREVERRLAAQGRKIENVTLDEMEKLWVAIKTEEKEIKKAG
jgi:ATP diphosphatase